ASLEQWFYDKRYADGQFPQCASECRAGARWRTRLRSGGRWDRSAQRCPYPASKATRLTVSCRAWPRRSPQNSRGDKTAIELFLAGIRALALQSRIVRILTGHAGK